MSTEAGAIESSSGAEPIVKSGSSSDAVSFDDLEALTEDTPKQTKVDKALGADNKNQRKEEADANEKPKAKTKDEPLEDGQERTKVSKPKSEEADGEEAPKVKTVKLKNGDADLEVPANAKITVKVNGKDETFDLQDVVNDFSGKTNWGRKFQELDTEKRAFHAERQELQSGIDTIFKLAVTDNQPLEAIGTLVDMLGKDGVKVIQDLQQKMFHEFQELSKLSPEQRAAKQAEDRAALLERKLQNRTEADARKSEQTGIAKRVEDVKAKYGMSDERFQQIYKTLAETTPANQLTPEFIGDVHNRWNQLDYIDELGLEMSLDQQAKQALAAEWLKDKDLTKAQMKSLATQVFGSKASKKSSGSKLQDKINRSSGTTASKPSERSIVDEAVTFDDL